MIITKWKWSEGVEIIHVRNQAIVGLPSLPLVIANNSCKMCFGKPSTSAKKKFKTWPKYLLKNDTPCVSSKIHFPINVKVGQKWGFSIKKW